MSTVQNDLYDPDDNELSVSEYTDAHQHKNSISQSSISLSKRTLPSVSAQGLQQLPLENYSTNTSNARYSNQSIQLKETDDIKQIENRNSIKQIFNIIYDDKQFSKFNKLYKYNNTKKTKTQMKTSIDSMNSTSNSGAQIIRICNHKNLDLCFKETIVSKSSDLKRCINEYKSLQTFYNVLYGLDISYKYTSLYINKKKGNNNYPKKVRLIMKYFDGEDLDDFLVDEDDNEVEFLFENDFRIILKKILNKLNILHNNYMLHCDIKPANIRINENSDKYVENDANYYDVNIVDFAYVEICQNMNKAIILNHIKGTPGFIAPEIIKNKKYSIKSDIFSIGCVAFFLLTNQYAVIQSNSMNIKDMMPDRKRLKSILKRENDRNRDNESRIHKKTIDFVLNCLWRNPIKRPSTQEALDNEIFQNV
eukprot:191831_1